MLLNDPNFVTAAEAFGARLAEIDAQNTPSPYGPLRCELPIRGVRGIEIGFQLCTGRAPDVHEIHILSNVVGEDGWTALAQVLLNLDETMTRG